MRRLRIRRRYRFVIVLMAIVVAAFAYRWTQREPNPCELDRPVIDLRVDDVTGAEALTAVENNARVRISVAPGLFAPPNRDHISF